MSATKARVDNRTLIDELGKRFPLLKQLVGRFGRETPEERVPWFFGLLLAAAANPNPGVYCVVLDKSPGTTALAAIFLSLIQLQDGFQKFAEDYAREALVPGQRVRVNPSKFVYEYGGLWDEFPGRVKLLAGDGSRSFPLPEVLRLEPTDLLKPKGTVNSMLGKFELSDLDKLLDLSTGGNNSLIKNTVMVQTERTRFREMVDAIMLARSQGVPFYRLSTTLPWGSVSEDGSLQPNDVHQVSGEPLIAVSRSPEDLATACLRSPKGTKIVLTDGASRIAGHLQALDDISDRQRLVVLASPGEVEALGLLRARGCPLWNMSAQELLIGEESPELRTRESLAGSSIRAADIRGRAKVTTVECNDEVLQEAADTLERVSALSSANSDGQEIELDLVAMLFRLVFECSECCFGVGEETKDSLKSVGDQIQREKAWMKPEVTTGLVETVNVLEKAMGNRYVPEKTEALLAILTEHIGEIGEGQWVVAARTQRTAERLTLGLLARGVEVPVMNIEAIPPDQEYQGIIVPAWPNGRRFSQLSSLSLTSDFRVLTYPFERRWVYNHQRNEIRRERSDRIEASELAAMLGMEAELLSSFEPTERGILSEQSESDSPILRVEERLSRRQVRRPVNPVNTADTREGRLIQFVGGCYSLLTEWSELPILNSLIDNTPGVSAELGHAVAWHLAVGDLVLFRAGGDKGFIRLLAEEHLGTAEYEKIRELAESWKPALRSLGGNLDEVLGQLTRVGLHRTGPTVSAWLNNPDRIGPGQGDDIEYIARAAANENLLSSQNDVLEAISQVRGSHIVAGRKLTQLILDSVQGRLGDAGGHPLQVDLDYGQAWVVQVQAVDSEVGFYPANQVNRLLWDIDSEY